MENEYLDEIVNRLSEQFPDLDHSMIQAVTVLSGTYHVLLSIIKRVISTHQITPQSMDVLMAIYVTKDQKCTLGEISGRLMVSPANVTGLVDGLLKKGLVRRREHPKDRRKRLTELTPKGLAVIEEFIPRCALFMQTVFASVSQEDKQQLYERLKQIFQHMLPYRDVSRMPKLSRVKNRLQVSSRGKR